MRDPFLKESAECLAEIDRREPPYTVSLAALDRIQRELDLALRVAGHPESALSLRKHVLTLFALSYRAARDLGLETADAAMTRDIPF